MMILIFFCRICASRAMASGWKMRKMLASPVLTVVNPE
jgi:hypothetical protein